MLPPKQCSATFGFSSEHEMRPTNSTQRPGLVEMSRAAGLRLGEICRQNEFSIAVVIQMMNTRHNNEFQQNNNYRLASEYMVVDALAEGVGSKILQDLRTPAEKAMATLFMRILPVVINIYYRPCQEFRFKKARIIQHWWRRGSGYWFDKRRGWSGGIARTMNRPVKSFMHFFLSKKSRAKLYYQLSSNGLSNKTRMNLSYLVRFFHMVVLGKSEELSSHGSIIFWNSYLPEFDSPCVEIKNYMIRKLYTHHS